MAFDVVVIGGGLAGLSAAARLSAGGARVLVAEARPALGGRASSFSDPATGEQVDNGQHLLLGCYHETFEFLGRIGASSNVRVQASLEVPILTRAGRLTTLICPPLPPPLHLMAGIAEWDGVGLRDRLSALRLSAPIRRAQRFLRTGRGWFPASAGETVENWLIRNGQARRLREMLWEPLALAALNQPAREAAAPVFLRVLAHMLGPGPADSAIAMPLRPLTAMYAGPGRAFIESQGGQVQVASPARVRIEGPRVAGIEVRGDAIKADAVIVAVPWFALAETIVGNRGAIEPIISAARATTASPIVTVNLWFDREVLPAPFVGLPGRTFQWAFDKRQVFGDSAAHLSLVSSGADAVVAESNEKLAALACDELAAALPGVRSARLIRSLVVRERRATFSLAPGQPERPGATPPVEGLLLAGDWTETGLPATIEGAVLSGHRAARLAAARLSGRPAAAAAGQGPGTSS
jgi:squalene-associated FAD-dependent desaturase